MLMHRWIFGVAAALLAALLMTAPQGQAQDGFDFTDYRETMNYMAQIGYDIRYFGAGSNGFFRDVGETGDPLYIAPLLDVGYFMFGRTGAEVEIYNALSELTGQAPDRGWRGYFEWASENDVELPPGYDEFKGFLFSLFVDTDFAQFFEDGVQETAQVNMLEAVWGGVVVDGIPSLVNARQVTREAALVEGQERERFCRAGDCTYPAPDELVFGVELDGDARAYPLRILNWHEMFNDVIGHTPMLDSVGGEPVCNFRAPTEFSALGRSGDDWVLVEGYSAGCPESGWLAAEALTWGDSDWESVRDQLPDLDEADALSAEEGIPGSVAGRPVMLAYCTLCGSGILYDVTIPDLTYTDLEGETVELGEAVLEFGSTGLLMRSNKLMYDRTTNTVWNALTGEPAFGPLATVNDLQLDLLPVVVTDWATWLEEHPDTSVLSLQTGVARDYTNGAAYSDYFNDPSFVMFPVWQQDETLAENKEMVFGLRLDGLEKAYPLDVLIEEQVSNDVLGETEVVIVTRATPDRDFFEPGGAAVRAYASDGILFSPGEMPNEVVDEDGTVWQVTEDALVSADGETLERLPGHLAFWFGWFGFYPDTLFYEGM